MVHVNDEEHAEWIVAKASDTPHNASRFECYKSLVPLIIGECFV